ELGQENPTLDFNVRKLVRTLTKLATDKKEATWPRHSLPVNTLKVNGTRMKLEFAAPM
ncbi:15073_t:CDS:2, partial [Racocetra persica]